MAVKESIPRQIDDLRTLLQSEGLLLARETVTHSQQEPNLIDTPIEAPIDVTDVVAASDEHKSVGSDRREITHEERLLYNAICKKGASIEGSQVKLSEKIGILLSVVKNVSNLNDTVKTLRVGDIDKIMDYARDTCPEIL